MNTQLCFERIKPGEWTEEDLKWLIPRRPVQDYPGADAVVERVVAKRLIALRIVGPARGIVLLEPEGEYFSIFWLAGQGVLRNLPTLATQLKAVCAGAGKKLKGYVPSEALAKRYLDAGASIRRWEMEF